ncbi:MAG: helix-turn-helix transcriptional regulator [Thermoguttaceae bacterium]|nr:helix-turn-helix transcriptional regulator [Thermoguttaceae bacterium]
MRNRLKTARLAKKLRQKDVAEKLGMKTASYSNWESGFANIPQAKIPLICQILQINEDWLRTGQGEMSNASRQETPSPYEIARELGCGDGAAQIFARYCELPATQKAAFEALVNNLFAAKQVSANFNPQTIKINGDNNNATIN